jgi:hypothetical protein
MQIDKDDADVIVRMAEVCYSEGIGPSYEDLLTKIAEAFPGIIPEYLPYR